MVTLKLTADFQVFFMERKELIPNVRTFDFIVSSDSFNTGVQRVARSLADLSLLRREKPKLPGERA